MCACASICVRSIDVSTLTPDAPTGPFAADVGEWPRIASHRVASRCVRPSASSLKRVGAVAGCKYIHPSKVPLVEGLLQQLQDRMRGGGRGAPQQAQWSDPRMQQQQQQQQPPQRQASARPPSAAPRSAPPQTQAAPYPQPPPPAAYPPPQQPHQQQQQGYPDQQQQQPPVYGQPAYGQAVPPQYAVQGGYPGQPAAGRPSTARGGPQPVPVQPQAQQFAAPQWPQQPPQQIASPPQQAYPPQPAYAGYSSAGYPAQAYPQQQPQYPVQQQPYGAPPLQQGMPVYPQYPDAGAQGYPVVAAPQPYGQQAPAYQTPPAVQPMPPPQFGGYGAPPAYGGQLGTLGIPAQAPMQRVASPTAAAPVRVAPARCCA
jgi:hypothetical protein